MRKRIASVTEFGGVDGRIAASRLPAGKASNEKNADRRLRGSWRPRSGLGMAYQEPHNPEVDIAAASWGPTIRYNMIVLTRASTGTLNFLMFQSSALTPDWPEEPPLGGFVSAPTLSHSSTTGLVVTLAAVHRSDYGAAYNAWRDGQLIVGEQSSGTITDTTTSGTHLYEVASVTLKRVSGEKASVRVAV